MRFKTKQKNLTFSDLENTLADDRNRSLKILMELDKAIFWGKIEEILLKDYPVGDKKVIEPIHLCCCSNAYCFRNGSGSNQILNLKARLLTGIHSGVF